MNAFIKPMLYLIDCQPTVVRRICSEQVCSIADFVFDKPVFVPRDAMLELVDGQWFLIHGGNRAHLDGHWQELRTP